MKWLGRPERHKDGPVLSSIDIELRCGRRLRRLKRAQLRRVRNSHVIGSVPPLYMICEGMDLRFEAFPVHRARAGWQRGGVRLVEGIGDERWSRLADDGHRRVCMLQYRRHCSQDDL